MKIPKYVYELVELGRLRPAPLDEQANSSMMTGTALLPTRISSTKTSEKRLANSSFILKM